MQKPMWKKSPTMTRVSYSGVIENLSPPELEVGHLEAMESGRAELAWLLAQGKNPVLLHTTALGPGKDPTTFTQGTTLTSTSLLEPTGKGNNFSMIGTLRRLLTHFTF